MRRKPKIAHSFREEEKKDKKWSQLAITSFAEGWENDKDAIYAKWREYYLVPEGRYCLNKRRMSPKIDKKGAIAHAQKEIVQNSQGGDKND